MTLNIWETVKGLIKTVAPAVATAIGGPLGGVAVRELSEIFLSKPNGTPEELENAIKGATPSQLITLKELHWQMLQLETQDVQSAREMNMQNIKINGHPDWINKWLVVWSTLLFTGVIFFVLYGQLFLGAAFNDDNFEKSILSFLFTLITNIFSFYCGRVVKR